jgi:UDPglucose--hexose-1-phosphate uridylyltransferase
MLDRELDTQIRLVSQSAHLVAFCPFASQFPYEVWIVPRRHCSDFADEGDEVIADASQLVKDVVGRVESALSKPAFNYLIHTSPFHEPASAFYHWHLEIFPRLTKTAGFEWGAGDYINTVSPEDAAGILRLAGQRT